MYIRAKIISNTSNREILGDVTAMQLLMSTPEEIVQILDDNPCSCDSESGYSYCGCGDEFEDCQLFIEGEEVKDFY